MAWRRPGDKPLSEPMMVSLLKHICVSWPQWVSTVELLVIWDAMMVYAYLVNIESFWYIVWAITFSVNRLASGWRQAITWTDPDSQSIGPQKQTWWNLEVFVINSIRHWSVQEQLHVCNLYIQGRMAPNWNFQVQSRNKTPFMICTITLSNSWTVAIIVLVLRTKNNKVIRQ